MPRQLWWIVLALLLGLPVLAPAALRWEVQTVYGERGRGRSELRDPMDVAVGDDDQVFVVDRARDAIVVFSDRGRWERTLGEDGDGPELGLREPQAIAVDRYGRIWVVDTGNHRILAIAADGTVLLDIGRLGTHDGRFRDPVDVTSDRSGRVYVADRGNERVQVFDRRGGFLEAWERRTRGRRDYLGAPRTLAFTPQGDSGIWVISVGGRRAERFDLEGDWEESRTLTSEPDAAFEVRHMEVEPAFYRMFVSDGAGRRVWVFDRRGRPLAEVPAPEGESWDPRGVAVNRSLDLFVVDGAGRRVLKFRKTEIP